jgi:hypothetical protein
MRERAEAATPGPWFANPGGYVELDEFLEGEDFNGVADTWNRSDGNNAAHIASWHPAVALAVADWLDEVAARAESKVKHGGNDAAVWSHERDALAVARAYLGEAS